LQAGRPVPGGRAADPHRRAAHGRVRDPDPRRDRLGGRDVSIVVPTADLVKAVGEDDGLTATDKRLLQYARQNLSPNEMSEQFQGLLSPSRCIARVREILRSHDYLSQVERRALVLLDMIELKEILLDHVRTEGGEVTNERTGETYYSFGDP